MITVLGNQMPKLKHNYFVGIRTPWTLANEEVWFATHRLAGPIWFAAGLIMMILAFIPGGLTGNLYVAVVMLAALIPTGYSYLAYRKAAGRG